MNKRRPRSEPVPEPPANQAEVFPDDDQGYESGEHESNWAHPEMHVAGDPAETSAGEHGLAETAPPASAAIDPKRLNRGESKSQPSVPPKEAPDDSP
jgi:hypothetical protein